MRLLFAFLLVSFCLYNSDRMYAAKDREKEKQAKDKTEQDKNTTKDAYYGDDWDGMDSDFEKKLAEEYKNNKHKEEDGTRDDNLEKR